MTLLTGETPARTGVRATHRVAPTRGGAAILHDAFYSRTQ